MALPIRLLLINSQVKFSANLKKALERSGGFEVAAFTSVETALEYARNRALDAVMVDFELRDGTAPDVIERLRGLQTDVAVIISPNTPETEAIGRHLGVQAVVDIPISARMLMPIVQRAVAQALDNMPDTVLGDNPQRGPGSLVTPQVPLP
ncbi:MAG TPA: response regulator, partial [Aggregatilineales bacterium]|nr:response regulator [Aggregatilineales bacterium]